MSKITDMVKEWTAGLLGGGTDLSAVDEDITVLNEHVLELAGPSFPADPTAHATAGWSDTLWATVLAGDPGASQTDTWFKARPDALGGLLLTTFSDGARIMLVDDNGNSSGLTFNSNTNEMQIYGAGLDLRVAPILVAPDESLHRLKVGSDGSLSTEPVV